MSMMNNFAMNQPNMNFCNPLFNSMNVNMFPNNNNTLLWGFPANSNPNMLQGTFVNFGGNMNTQMLNPNNMNFMNNQMNNNMNCINNPLINSMNCINNPMNNNMNCINTPMNNNMNCINNPMNNSMNCINTPMNMYPNQMNNNMNFMNTPMNNNMNCINNPMNVNNLANSFNAVNNLCNSFNNLSINNNFQNNMYNSQEIKQTMNISDVNSEVQINFRFVNAEIFKISAKLGEKFIDVIDKFKNDECPKELRKCLSLALFNGEKIKDLSKTLLELNIKNGAQILFMDCESEIDNKEQNDKKDKEEEYILTERENEQMKKLRLEYDTYKSNKAQNTQQNNNNTNEENEQNNDDNFDDFLIRNDRQIGVSVKEHEHKLVYCVTDLNWSCNTCNTNYNKEDGKYFCSLCDYSMCENCHYNKKYFMKKSFPPGIKPSNSSVNIHCLKAAYHDHRLVYCRSSRHFYGFNHWNCDNCRNSFSNKTWSFYCTVCDFDLCSDCCGFH